MALAFRESFALKCGVFFLSSQNKLKADESIELASLAPAPSGTVAWSQGRYKACQTSPRNIHPNVCMFTWFTRWDILPPSPQKMQF